MLFRSGGVSNGEPLVIRAAVKPISTLARPLPSADLISGEKVEKAHYERSDISVVPAAGVIGEAMVALALIPFLLEKLGGDSLEEIEANLSALRTRAATPRTFGTFSFRTRLPIFPAWPRAGRFRWS